MAPPTGDYDQPTRVAVRPAEPKPIVVLGSYRIVKLLGQGGMGKVYLGYHTALNRYAAIKTIRTDFKQLRRGMMDRFTMEMKASGKVRHSNVVLALDAGSTNGVFYLVMEYLRGHDLGQIASAYGKLQPADACELIRQAALGLDAIHGTMTHRDVKPSNIMLTDEGIVKILDLGLARLNELEGDNKYTPSGFVLGTHDYMSPEQAAGGYAIDHRADIYSLGCTFFRLLAGHAPYDGEDYSTSARKILAHQSVPMEDVRDFGTLPTRLRSILLRMTAKDPNDRFGTAAEVAEALLPHCAGHTIAALVQRNNITDAAPVVDEDAYDDAHLLATGVPADTDRDREPTRISDDHLPTRLGDGFESGKVRRFGRPAAIAALVLLCVAGLGAYYSITPPGLRSNAPSPIPELSQAPRLVSGAHSVDDLPKRKENFLFDRVPVATPPLPSGESNWRIDPETRRLSVGYDDSILLQFGTTRSKDYTILATMNQVPWIGEAGLFWGYRELPEAARLKAENKPYATLHHVYLCKRESFPPKFLPVRYTMVRGCGEVWVDLRGTTCINRREYAEHTLPWVAGPAKTLELEICDGSLQRANFNGVPLDSFRKCEAEVPKRPAGTDGFGIVTYGYHANFDNLRFISTSTTGE
jgi:serine/threonine protein kinase